MEKNKEKSKQLAKLLSEFIDEKDDKTHEETEIEELEQDIKHAQRVREVLNEELSEGFSKLTKSFDKLKEELAGSFEENETYLSSELTNFQEEIQSQFEEHSQAIDEAFTALEEKYEGTEKTNSRVLAELGERMNGISELANKEFESVKGAHKIFNDGLKLLEENHKGHGGKFDIVDKRFLSLEKDLKKYASQIYEYGSTFSVLKNGQMIGQTNSINFKNGTVTANGNTIDYTAPDTSAFIDNEIVSGSGTSFTLAHTPIAGSVHLYGMGQRLTPGAGNDYTITGTAISIIQTGASYPAGSILADYRY